MNQEIWNRTEWFRKERFGMFIHWGLYAIPGGEWNGKVYEGAAEWLKSWAKVSGDEWMKLMEQWNPEKIYDRMGVDTQFATILGVKIPMLTIPVKPGRNLAVILEVAAMNNRQKKMGYNAAAELLDQLGLDMEAKEVVKDYDAF